MNITVLYSTLPWFCPHSYVILILSPLPALARLSPPPLFFLGLSDPSLVPTPCASWPLSFFPVVCLISGSGSKPEHSTHASSELCLESEHSTQASLLPLLFLWFSGSQVQKHEKERVAKTLAQDPPLSSAEARMQELASWLHANNVKVLWRTWAMVLYCEVL